MNVVFRPHAVERMIERGLKPGDIEAVLNKPDGTIRQSRDKRVYYKALRGRKDNDVAVVALEGQTGFEVITVLVNFEVKHDR